jgi:MoxR-like ATPase
MEQHSPEENLYEVQQEKKALREIAHDEDTPDRIKEDAKKGVSEIRDEYEGFTGFIKEQGGLAKAKERFRADKEHALKSLEINSGIDEIAVLEEMGESKETYENIASSSKELESIRDFEMQQIFDIKTDPHARKAHERLLATARGERESVEKKLAELSKNNPREARAFELIRDKMGLSQEGHIAPTKSVQEHLVRIGKNMQIGKPMFLHGPTGTGKTSLARFAAEHFTGKSAEMIYCSPQTRESAIWGKTGIRPTEHGGIETVDIFGPLSKAMQEGKTVIFDEFSALPREQMVFIKGIFNAKVGDDVNIVGNGKIKIAPGFQMMFTANLKSEKNPERQELPPEIAREFEQNNIKINYLPKEEAYDIMLARLMNPDGSVDSSMRDLNVTMPKLCEAMEEIQTAYTGALRPETARLTGTMDVSGKAQGLKKLVMTQGTIEAMLESWKAEKQTEGSMLHGGGKQSFVEFIDQRLKIGLTFEEYPLADRMLAAKILASKGFLRTITPAELGLPVDVFNFDAARKIREKGEQGETVQDLKEISYNETNVSIMELASLDPFEIRKTSAKEKAEKITQKMTAATKTSPKAEQATTLEEVKEENQAFLKKTFEGWYDKNKAKVEQIPIIVDPRTQNYAALKGDTDSAKFGEYTVNPEMTGIDFETIPPEKIKILDLKDFQGKPLHEVAEHIIATFGDTHYIPGIEFWKWIIESYDKAPRDVQEKYKELKDGNYYFQFGSLVRGSRGFWFVPYASRDGSKWLRLGGWLDSGWHSRYRVVLFEK